MQRENLKVYFILAASVLAGVTVGWLTYKNEAMVMGGIGFGFLLEVIRRGFPAKDDSLEKYLSRSNHFVTIFEIFFLSLFSLWASFSVGDLLFLAFRYIVSALS